ncbi:MAG: hypothetical protein K1Y01_10300 [Vicinamibacteria bacterium]|nr:hypothetical protein [Vicinamibacteria bacterium]
MSNAIERLRSKADGAFDVDAYGRSFHQSAKNKAADVIKLLGEKDGRFFGLTPCFVSIGGADGTELASLLAETNATHGILIEGSRELASVARSRILPNDKRIEVFEGDAVREISKALARSQEIVRSGRANFQAVTCHAVIHELFDRGNGFDPAVFFGTIFGDAEIPTWFTYREPGAQEKWPERLLVAADCGAKLLVELAELLRQRHPVFRGLSPAPTIVGDHMLAHRDLAMEVIVKLFYLDDLAYELEERSTSVHHQQMQAFLLLAIGESAAKAGRGLVDSFSAATESFRKLWQEWGLQIAGLAQNGSRIDLAVPESQTRVVAWRVPSDGSLSPSDSQATVPKVEAKLAPSPSGAIAIAADALDRADDAVLEALLVSKGRSWIEQDDRETAVLLLRAVLVKYPKHSLLALWCHYLLSLCILFEGKEQSADAFSDELLAAADGERMGVLFLAERMEVARKRGADDNALAHANLLAARLRQVSEVEDHTPLERYAIGTSFFVYANLLRSGGLYTRALESIENAEKWLLRRIESHDTERLHCFYARSVCGGIQGTVSFNPPFERLSDVNQRFAAALIQLTYANASWFVDDLQRAAEYAAQAADSFDAIGSVKHSRRARTIGALFKVWNAFQEKREIPLESLTSEWAKAVEFLTGRGHHVDWFREWFPTVRPSVAAGLLQFCRFSRAPVDVGKELRLPRVLAFVSGDALQWRELTASSTSEAEALLRDTLGAPAVNRIPLFAD